MGRVYPPPGSRPRRLGQTPLPPSVFGDPNFDHGICTLHFFSTKKIPNILIDWGGGSDRTKDSLGVILLFLLLLQFIFHFCFNFIDSMLLFFIY